MSITIMTKRYLENQGIRYATMHVPENRDDLYRYGSDNIRPEYIAKSVILRDARGMMMAIIPAPNDLHLQTLNQRLHRKFQPIDKIQHRGFILNCSAGHLPCLGEALGFETIIDDSLLNNERIYFTSGSGHELMRLTGYDFQILHSNAWYGNTFSSPPPAAQHEPAAISGSRPFSKIRQQIEHSEHLPAMPTMAQQIVQLNANPYAHANDLALLIDRDPNLATQIIRHAQSPFYGYQGKLTTVKQAISRVLGYDLVMNIALGIAATRPFGNDFDGPMGIEAYWRHATYSAALCQSICTLIPRIHRPRPGTAYLCGLLHNFGFLLLGHLYPQELQRLNQAIRENPLASVRTLERKLFHTDHTEIGGHLMKTWNMPPEIIVTVMQHHNMEYHGEHAEYARLVMLADILLKGHGLGDAGDIAIPAELLQQLHLREDRLYFIFEKTIQGREDLDSIAKQMAA